MGERNVAHEVDRAHREQCQSARTGITPETEGFWPCSTDMSRRELVDRIGLMNFRLTHLRRENASLRVADVHARLDALLLRMREEHYTPTYADLLAVKGTT